MTKPKTSLLLKEHNNFYQPPFFKDNNRLSKIKMLFPKIANLYSQFANTNHIPGYAFGIMLDGELIYSGSGGFINNKEKLPATISSMFRIASMTKSLTAMAILKLRDEGKLVLEEPAYLYFPEIKQQRLTKDAPNITLRDLLIHSAGFPKDDPWADRELHKSNEELLALLQKGISFSNTPGTTYEYSNLAYAMLGSIIQKITHISYQEYINKNIFAPLGMLNTAWEFTTISSNQLAHGYRWINNQLEEEKLLGDGIFAAMGGLITSIKDFSRYVALHQLAWPARNDAEIGPLKRSSIREMQQPWRFYDLHANYQYLDNKESGMSMAYAYGYGLRWLRDSKERIYVGHGGGLPGFGSHWLIMPDYGIGVIIFANKTYAIASDKLSVYVLNMLIEEGKLQPRQLPASFILKERQKELLKLLPSFENVANTKIFAENFFQDSSVLFLQKITTDYFRKAGEIVSIEEIVPKDQLSGYFIMKGKITLKISFTLTPQSPPLIQTYTIEEV